MFSNENLCKAQQKKENDTSNNDESISNNVLETPDTSPKGRYPRAKEMHSDTYVHLKIHCVLYVMLQSVTGKLGRKFQLWWLIDWFLHFMKLKRD